jgi:hypothetical protein
VAQLGLFHSGVEAAQNGAAGHVAEQGQAVPCGEDGRLALELRRFAQTEDADAHKRPLGHLAQHVSAKFALDVVDGDDRDAVAQQRSEPLLGFLRVLTGGDDRTGSPRGDGRRNIDEERLARARRTLQGFEAMLWLRKGFGFSGPWTVCEQNRLLAVCFGLPQVNKA